MKRPLASIIINNYNYGRFLSEAIDSALKQDYYPTEVIVVDDGSTDNSQQIIASYGERIIPIFKENGGQGAAFNAGFAASRGEVVCFLDSDDILLPTATGTVIKLLNNSHTAQVHWPLSVIDTYGNLSGRLIPEQPLPKGNLYQEFLEGRMENYGVSPTSGNAWSRDYLTKILPIPETEYQFNADSYLLSLAPLFGEIRRIDEYQTLYRVHNNNGTSKRTYKWQLRHHQNEMLIIQGFLEKQGAEVDCINTFKRRFSEHPYFKFLQSMIQLGEELETVILPGKQYILVDMNEFGACQFLENSLSIPFLEKNGMYWGPPPDNETAIQELERLRHEVASAIVFGWPAFWWLDYYTGFSLYLRNNFPCVLENERLIVFDLHLSI